MMLDWLDDPHDRRAIHLAEPSGQWRDVPYSELADYVYRVAALLREAGVPRNGVVVLMLADPLDFVVSFMAVLAVGGTPSPIATPLTFRGRERYVQHVADILRAAGPAAVLADGAMADLAAEAAQSAEFTGLTLSLSWDNCPGPDYAARRAPADLALLQFTSGSSGQPKGVRVSWDNLAANLGDIRHWLCWSAADSMASWLPLYHDMGLVGGFLTPVTAGSDLWLLQPDQFLRNPLRWLECFGRHDATVTTAPSFGYAYAARRTDPSSLEGMDFSGWRVAILGAERIDPVSAAGFTALLAPYGFRSTALVPAYGLAEATLAVSGLHHGRPARVVKATPGARDGQPVVIEAERRLGLDAVAGGGWLTGCGQPLRTTVVHVADEEGRLLPDGHLGELIVSGASVAQGYQTADGGSVFPPEGLATGDTGFVLDGEVFVVGRIGDSLKVRGARLHAEDVEADVAAVPGIQAGRSAAVLGSVDGIDIAAVIVEDNAAAWLDDVVVLLRGLIAGQARLAIFCGRRGSIPRTSSGKPRRRVIWRQLISGEFAYEQVYSTWDAADGDCPWVAAAPAPAR